MRFCMVSTFYPPYHFGGDAVYVQRLSQALVRRGHTVDVIHDRDAYYLGNGTEPEAPPAEDGALRVHALKSRLGFLSPLLTQQTARPWFKSDVRRYLESGRYDVVHFHNPSLIGSTTFGYGDAVKLYTLHDHWLICPMHVLWKLGREKCDQPQCVRCCLQARRPPQFWRYTGRLERDIQHIDRFLSPSRFTRDRHRSAGLDLPISVLPNFVPLVPAGDRPAPHVRPYFLFVGRLVKLKGVDTLIRAFRQYRGAADLLIAGDGEEGAALRHIADDMPRVRFMGSVAPADLPALYRHAIALVMPSIGYETFGTVLLEALAASTPVIARNLGGMPEVVRDSGGGILYSTDDELISACEQLQSSPEVRNRLGETGHDAVLEKWSEDRHIEAYLQIVEDEMRRRSGSNGGPART